jgi:hypothetical protein
MRVVHDMPGRNDVYVGRSGWGLSQRNHTFKLRIYEGVVRDVPCL